MPSVTRAAGGAGTPGLGFRGRAPPPSCSAGRAEDSRPENAAIRQAAAGSDGRMRKGTVARGEEEAAGILQKGRDGDPGTPWPSRYHPAEAGAALHLRAAAGPMPSVFRRSRIPTAGAGHFERRGNPKPQRRTISSGERHGPEVSDFMWPRRRPESGLGRDSRVVEALADQIEGGERARAPRRKCSRVRLAGTRGTRVGRRTNHRKRGAARPIRERIASRSRKAPASMWGTGRRPGTGVRRLSARLITEGFTVDLAWPRSRTLSMAGAFVRRGRRSHASHSEPPTASPSRCYGAGAISTRSGAGRRHARGTIVDRRRIRWGVRGCSWVADRAGLRASCWRRTDRGRGPEDGMGDDDAPTAARKALLGLRLVDGVVNSRASALAAPLNRGRTKIEGSRRPGLPDWEGRWPGRSLAHCLSRVDEQRGWPYRAGQGPGREVMIQAAAGLADRAMGSRHSGYGRRS